MKISFLNGKFKYPNFSKIDAITELAIGPNEFIKINLIFYLSFQNKKNLKNVGVF